MHKELLFTERQRFTQWWVWLILLSINFIFLFGAFKQVILGDPFGSRPLSNTALLIAAGVTLGLVLLFINLRLETQVRSDGIYARFFPFHRRFRRFGWNRISRAFIRTYNPLAEYGGWGLRLGLMAKGIAFNVAGNKGLQLELTDGRKILIGTNKPTELARALEQIGQLQP